MQVIFAGRLIDGTGAAAQRDRAVYVEDGRILGIDRIGDVPSDAQVIDHSSHSVLPGLIDCHVHLVFSHSANPLHEVLAEDDFQLLPEFERPYIGPCRRLFAVSFVRQWP